MQTFLKRAFFLAPQTRTLSQLRVQSFCAHDVFGERKVSGPVKIKGEDGDARSSRDAIKEEKRQTFGDNRCRDDETHIIRTILKDANVEPHEDLVEDLYKWKFTE